MYVSMHLCMSVCMNVCMYASVAGDIMPDGSNFCHSQTEESYITKLRVSGGLLACKLHRASTAPQPAQYDRPNCAALQSAELPKNTGKCAWNISQLRRECGL
uniref:Secreted protein n=1 Tax=Anguilla anguilla TaxID=7936 RepID=A0A0E9VNA6_ANGAN